MAIKPDVACSIVQGLAEFAKIQEFDDFVVTIDEVQFKCKRLILAACSEFFRGLFRSGMKETEQNCVTLKEISSETFEIILEGMYTGHADLTNDNVIDIWKAANQLQINFMVSECESFIIEHLSLDNYLEYLYASKSFNSDAVLKAVWSFILKNCDAFFQTSCFLELPVADFAALIKSQDLITKSEEDIIDAILKWAEFQDNGPNFSGVASDGIPNTDTVKENEENESDSDGEPTRKKSRKCHDDSTLIGCLDNNVPTDSSIDSRSQGGVTNEDVRRYNFTMLLSHARTYLASQRYLEFLVNHPLVKQNKEARNLVNDALTYHLQIGKRNGHWPSRAIQRGNSDYMYCIVGANVDVYDMSFNAYTLTSKKCVELLSLFYVGKVKLAVVDNKMYCLYTRLDFNTMNSQNNAVNGSTSSPGKRIYIFQFLTNTWYNIKISLNVRSDDFNVAVVDSFLYIFSAEDQKVWKLDPATRKARKVFDLPVRDAIAYVMLHYQWILVFYTSTAGGVDETVVRCYDTSEKTWNQLKKFEGPANGMTSFKDDNFTYLLQSNGSLWKVVQSQSDFIDFEFVIKLWNGIWPLHVAFVFMGNLYVGVKHQNQRSDPRLMRSLPGVFTEIIYHDMTSFGNSGVTPFIFRKDDIDKLPPVRKLSYHTDEISTCSMEPL